MTADRMDEALFLDCLQRADAFREAGAGDRSLWIGYRNGLRRRQFGEEFGTEGQHRFRLSIPGDHPDPSHRAYGIGYRAGFRGEDPAALIGRRAGSVAGEKA